MTIEIKVPTLPESVTDATVSKWHKKAGDRVERDENLVDLETDKVMLEVPAPHAGVIEKITASEGNTVKAGQLLALINDVIYEINKEIKKTSETAPQKTEEKNAEELSPAVRRLIAENGVDINKVKGSGKDNRITKEDVENYIQSQKQSSQKT